MINNLLMIMDAPTFYRSFCIESERTHGIPVWVNNEVRRDMVYVLTEAMFKKFGTDTVIAASRRYIAETGSKYRKTIDGFLKTLEMWLEESSNSENMEKINELSKKTLDQLSKAYDQRAPSSRAQRWIKGIRAVVDRGADPEEVIRSMK